MPMNRTHTSKSAHNDFMKCLSIVSSQNPNATPEERDFAAERMRKNMLAENAAKQHGYQLDTPQS